VAPGQANLAGRVLRYAMRPYLLYQSAAMVLEALRGRKMGRADGTWLASLAPTPE
jgi:hypothetical protein